MTPFSLSLTAYLTIGRGMKESPSHLVRNCRLNDRQQPVRADIRPPLTLCSDTVNVAHKFNEKQSGLFFHFHSISYIIGLFSIFEHYL